MEALKRLSDVSTPTEKVKPELNSNSITDQTKTSEENQQSDDENPGLILNERAILKRNVAPDDSGTENEQKSLNSPTSQKFPDIASALEDLPTFAIEWKPIRALTQCSCGTPMDNLSRKVRPEFI